MASTVTNKLNRNLLLTLKTANAFHMNSASTTKFKSILTLGIHIWANWPSLTANDRSQKFSQKLVDFGMFFVFPKKSFAPLKHGARTLIFGNRIGMALIL
jgi:hypothetical protein